MFTLINIEETKSKREEISWREHSNDVAKKHYKALNQALREFLQDRYNISVHLREKYGSCSSQVQFHSILRYFVNDIVKYVEEFMEKTLYEKVTKNKEAVWPDPY